MCFIECTTFFETLQVLETFVHPRTCEKYLQKIVDYLDIVLKFLNYLFPAVSLFSMITEKLELQNSLVAKQYTA